MSAERPTLAMVTDSIHPYFSGGKESRTYELSHRLTKDFEVHVYTMKWWAGPRVLCDGAVTLHGVCPRTEMYKPQGRRSIRQAALFAVGCIQLATARFDVLEADHMPYLHLFVLRLICWARRRRMVVTWHEVWGREYWRSYLGVAGIAAHFVEEVAMRLPDAILAASEQTADRLRSSLGASAAVRSAPNGVDLDAIDATVPASQAKDIVTVGRLMPHKRLDLLLAVVDRLKGQRRPVTCRIIGNGPERERLVEEAERLGLVDEVEFCTGVSENAELIGLVKSGRVFVLPSEREGFGIAALEGLACGLPTITTSAPHNLAQYLVAAAPGGYVCDLTVESIADNVDTILASNDIVDPAVRRRWAEAYSWPTIADTVSEVLRG